MATSTQQGNDIYLRNKIMTATPAELTLLLYEGAIKFANKAIMAIEKNDMSKDVWLRPISKKILKSLKNVLLI